MWILKIPNSTTKNIVSEDRVKLRAYAKDKIDGDITFVLPQDYDKDNFVHDRDMIFYVCSNDHKIGTIEWITILE